MSSTISQAIELPTSPYLLRNSKRINNPNQTDLFVWWNLWRRNQDIKSRLYNRGYKAHTVYEIVTKDKKTLWQYKEKQTKAGFPTLKNLRTASFEIICPFFTLTKEWPTFSMIRQWLRLNARGTDSFSASVYVFVFIHLNYFFCPKEGTGCPEYLTILIVSFSVLCIQCTGLLSNCQHPFLDCGL